jgi:hypothetical protein
MVQLPALTDREEREYIDASNLKPKAWQSRKATSEVSVGRRDRWFGHYELRW